MKKDFIKLHFAIFLFGFTPILGKLISINALSLVWWRIIISIVVLFTLLKLKNTLQKPSRSFLLSALLVSFFTILNWGCFYACIKLSNISIAMITFSLISIFTAIIEPLVFKTKFSTIEILLGLLSLVGISLIYKIETQFQMGILVGVISAFFASLNSVYNRKVVNTYTEMNPSNIMFYEMLLCLPLLSVLIFLTSIFLDARFEVPIEFDWLWVSCLAVFCTVISFQLILQVFKKINTFTVNISFNMEPFYGILMAFLFFDESKYFTRSFYIGFMLVLSSTLFQMLHIWIKQKKKK